MPDISSIWEEAQAAVRREAFIRDRVLANKKNQHLDDLAADAFNAELKLKLMNSRNKGRSGWETCSQEALSLMLRDHVEKGDPRDVAAFCMMLWNLGYSIK